MKVTSETKLACVIGDPITSSLSPVIHNRAYKELGIDAKFIALRVTKESSESFFNIMKSAYLIGASVTMPLKDIVERYVKVDEQSKLIGASNAVFPADYGPNVHDQLVGANTDGEGFVRSLNRILGLDVKGMNVAVIGAGGAARAIVYALSNEEAKSICVINRSEESGKRVANLAKELGRVGKIEDVYDCDLIVQTTPFGMKGTTLEGQSIIDQRLIRESHVVADIVVNPRETKLMELARSKGATVIGGLPMLIEQAALAFKYFTHREAPIEAMYDEVGLKI